MSLGKVLGFIFLPLFLLAAVAGGLLFWRKSKTQDQAAAAALEQQKAEAAKALAQAQAARQPTTPQPVQTSSSSTVESLKSLLSLVKDGVDLYKELTSSESGLG